MADQSHLDILQRGVEAWNLWRERNPSVTPNLTQAGLYGVSLPRAFLLGAALERANRQGADLHEALLVQANLKEAALKETDLHGAGLEEANLEGANLEGANLEGANLEGARLEGANLEGAKALNELQIGMAFGDETTTLPEDLRRPASPFWASKGTDHQTNGD